MRSGIRYLFFLSTIVQASLVSAQSGSLPKVQSTGIVSERVVTLLAGEKWWGGAVTEAQRMPFETGYSLDLKGDNRGNQAAPLLLSSAGRFIWSEQPFQFSFNKDSLILSGMIDSVIVGGTGHTLADAYQEASSRCFPASGKMPDSLLIGRPQYNTWIELIYDQNQRDILKYAHAIIDNGFLPGVFMIDDNWFDSYGRFLFRKDRFPDAKEMISELHRLGFKVMVWVSPFISPDTEVFREAAAQRIILYDNKGKDSLQWQFAREPALIHWWNGYSALLDFTNPAAVQWFNGKLRFMTEEYGVDGFKFDAGDTEFYPGNIVSYRKANANEHCALWGAFGLEYPLNEYRAMWKRGGEPLAERLRDKSHTFEDLQKLIPHTTLAGLLGYPFVCPDMIGGGDFGSFTGNRPIDQDLVVRSAQCQVLMPMMQFSVAPWRILDSVHLAAVKKAVALRAVFTPAILQLARQAAVTGIPIVRSLEYVFPHQGLENIQDEFMLGDDWLVAPVLTASSRRKIIFPAGEWKDAEGNIFKGPGVREMDIPIDKLTYFERVRQGGSKKSKPHK
ncbi:MAG TPA: glycoside hydrolase family 31 protein [Puia sp.]|nr:glycoside hydrolase family 31 protein [Puia sp.]